MIGAMNPATAPTASDAPRYADLPAAGESEIVRSVCPTAIAGPDCTLVLVDEAAFGDLVRRVPGLALEVMKVMARRLRRTNPFA